MNDKHLKIEIESYKELVNINQKSIIKNAIVCISCGYLCFPVKIRILLVVF